ncbi:hypothetical protein DYB26_005689 [Aphanomyces astaci]|uniref:Uncharacterized protein n=1 Tax=Aphanomyces astaci TaxID=112090 RepID=A0A397A4L5_APHAT|nr:hypothetical protein DYB36_013272 [Aphanomyces astaci]RHY74516.1 hypothetical protein DYB38_013347 [Aphanomyces astaci]RHZ08640.1 hypothetical protein DYB31_013272 [Aphanomyces astaci]RHZ16544.1 hypothetical protein DYB26_005689 [Aphanomyces astaci]
MAVALDDILITVRPTHKLCASGIWLNNIHSSDHTGTPFMVLELGPGDHMPSRLSGVKPIRVVNTHSLTKEDISMLGHTSQLLLDDRLPPLITAPPHAATTWSPQDTTDWLEGALQNLYDILYTGAKLKWGETSQTRKALNRVVGIQRSNRCTTQLRLHIAEPPTGEEYLRLVLLVEWPKWIRNPNLLLSACWHRSGAIAIDTGLDSDRLQGPHFVGDWLSHDMDHPDVVAQAFQTPAGTRWDNYHYDEAMQARCERSLRTRVSPGHEGVSQKLWIAAPTCIRERD